MMPILYNLVLIMGVTQPTVMPSAYYKDECTKYAKQAEQQTDRLHAFCIPLGEPNQLPAELGKK